MAGDGSASTAEGLPAEFSDSDHHWTGFSARARVIIYNTNRVAKGDVPTSIYDLAFFATNYRLARPESSIAYPVEVSQSASAAPVAALTMAAAPAILPGDANRDGAVDDTDASTLALNWQKQTAATWAEGDFNADGLVDDLDAAILAQHWMMTVKDLDDDDARDSIFATIGATDDALGLYDE